MTETTPSPRPNPAPRLWSDIAANAYPAFGCLGWLLLVPCLDSYDQSEQLARFFAALFNLFLIGIVGGTSTVLCLLGWYWSRRTEQRSSFRVTRFGRITAKVGLVIGAILLLIHVPYFAWYLH